MGEAGAGAAALLMRGGGVRKIRGEGTTLQTMYENEGECNNTAERRVLR